MADLNFDSIQLIRIPFSVGDKNYYLEEADGEAGSEYRDAKMAGMRGEFDSDGNLSNRTFSLNGLSKSELVLLSHCTYAEDGSKVDYEEIKRWPDRVTQRLVEEVKRISELGDTKNPTQRSEQNTTTIG